MSVEIDELEIPPGVRPIGEARRGLLRIPAIKVRQAVRPVGLRAACHFAEHFFLQPIHGVAAEGPMVRRLSGGGRWIRTIGSWSGDQTVMGDGPGCLEKGADLIGNRRFESTSLQR
jgi:hypothetical protein